MKRVLWIGILLFTGLLHAEQAYEKEILYLLNAVKTTECMYERNGEIHSGPEAVKHIQKKYDHFKDDIITAEDFIRLSATKSMISGQKYHIICIGKKPYDSDKWLLQKLQEYRSNLNKKETK